MTHKNHYQVLVVGGGAAGMSIAHALLKKGLTTDLAIVEPSDRHYYQPMWTLVGAGVVKKEKTVKPTKNLIPHGACWIQDAVTEFLPDENAVNTKRGKIFYDYLVATPGFELRWDKIKGAKESLGKNGVCSIYSYDTVDDVWNFIQKTKKGDAVFTFPSNPIKCGGAPQKIMYLAEHHFRKAKVRKNINVTYMAASPSLFAVKKYADALTKKVVIPRQINTCFQQNLIEIKSQEKEAVFENVATKELTTIKYDFLHITPPMEPCDAVQKSPLANKAGFIEVDPGTTQHVKYKNVFSIGDASSLPTSRTAAAVRAAFPVLIENLSLVMKNQEPRAIYDGYTSCPLLTSYGKVMLAEFDYQLTPKETLPFDQAKESRFAYALKRFVIPVIYWKGMLKGKRWPLFD